MKYSNPWHKPHNPTYGPEFYECDHVVFELGDFKIFKHPFRRQWDYVYKDMCIKQLCGKNVELVKALHENKPPEFDSAQHFLYESAKEIMKRAV